MPVQLSPTNRCCLNIQRSLDAIAGENAPASIRESFGFMDALLSPVNTVGFEQVPTDTAFPGKRQPQTGGGAANVPRIEIKYLTPVRRTAATSASDLCDPQTARGEPYDYMDVTVTQTRALGGSFTKDDFNALCETPSERLAIEIARCALDIQRAVNDQLITLAYGVVGNYADGTASSGGTAKSLPVVNGAGHANPAAMAAVRSQFRRQHTSTPPIVVGGDILNIWFDTADMAGLGANALQARPGAFVGNVETFVDFQVDTVVQGIESDTNSHVISWIPGAYQMLDWYKYVGYWEELDKEDYSETTIVVDGMRFDFILNYDKCTHAWNWELSKNFDLFYIPDAAYTQGADVWTFNRRLHWLATCGDFSCAAYAL